MGFIVSLYNVALFQYEWQFFQNVKDVIKMNYIFIHSGAVTFKFSFSGFSSCNVFLSVLTCDMYKNLYRRATSSNLPMAMRFRHLKETSKEAVGVYRSNIHGRGLFCLRDIEAGEMVIEYAGEVIRSMLTDKREKYYETKDIGCYMFRIDDQLVVDATMRGNAARFINHSCEVR